MKTSFTLSTRATIAAVSLAVYGFVFTALHPIIGFAAASFNAIPAVTFGWLFGVRGGVLYLMLAVPENMLLFRFMGNREDGGFLQHLIGSSMFMIVGSGIGWIRGLIHRVKRQAAELEAERKSLQDEIVRRTFAEERLAREALHDALTNLPNRKLFFSRLEHAFAWSKRNPDALYAVLYLDLNRFKNINDTLGHGAGDELLVQVASRLRSSVRTVDTVARMGGDEFAILLEVVSTPEDITIIVQRIQTSLSRPYDWSGGRIDAGGASIGIVIGLTGYDQIDSVLQDADFAMYHAKENGGNHFTVYDKKMRLKQSKLGG